MLDFKKLASADYLFRINTISLTRSDKFYPVIGIAFIVLAILLKIAAIYAPTPVDKQVRNRFYKMFLTIGLLEAVWYAFRYQNIRFFGSHFVALLILLVGLVWFGFILYFIWKSYRTEKTAWEKEQVKLKYLPK